ncbi:putative ferric-chelate reductase 1 [Nelusetta ayraudi]|uniref:putative ferric-chelate reductase 1 n=1 Tax=Nelusetta ayraudi TaxID=303726 RepID=UPI003F725C30
MSPVGLPSLLFISILVRNWAPADGYANGKVTKSCDSMVPRHGSVGETTPSPYQLATNSTTFRPKDSIRVILSGKSYFKGFLLEARDAANWGSVATVGTFTLTSPGNTQLLTCHKHQDSAVSHRSDAKKTEVAVVWNAPVDAPDYVQFFVSVVAEFNQYWVKLPGPVISQRGAPPLTTQSHTTPPVQTTTPSILPGPFSSQGCGHSKSCVLDPPGCNPQTDPRCFFLSMATEGPDKTSVVFELSGPAEGYVSFALSWDTWMGNDDVYLCLKDGDRVSVSAASVSGRTHPENQTQSALASVSWRLADGAMQCRFSRRVKVSHQEPGRFDLDQDYFLFLASGQAQHGKISRHGRQPFISSQKKLITGSPEVLLGSRSPIIMKMHGVLMLIAWMLTGSVGTFIASFYKPEWPDKTLLGQKIWFQVHRGLMTLTVALTVAAFCLPFFYRRGWSKRADVHPYLGCCVLVLSLTQPIMAAFRPSPDSSRRFIFNWAHWGVGYSTEIMAVAAMFVGMKQASLLLPQPGSTHVLIGYVAWLASLRILLLVHKHVCVNRLLGLSDSQCADRSSLAKWTPIIKSLILAVLVLGNTALLGALLHSITVI